MATHHGKEGVVTAGGTAVGELTSFTLETTGDVVEDTALTDATKSFVAGRTSFSGTLEMSYDETDSPQQTLTAGTSINFTQEDDTSIMTMMMMMMMVMMIGKTMATMMRKI